ncbi:major facilitator superfamily transporter [Podospora appendiculata]|uniref:Major facilitator superfamily transporter n=1 Tax=Podospora appendiculata TaxID=314037 RepID=A0AAE0X5H9_9PEZI|nr:major facilitator superfamily transporter [Podospora appendiculata]
MPWPLFAARKGYSRLADLTTPSSSAEGGEEEAAVEADPNRSHDIRNTDKIARRVLRKIDRRLIPLLFVTYMLNFMDKTILSSASVFGLQEDTGLEGQDYSWVSSIFYFGYFVWAYPTTFLIARLPPAKYLAGNTLFWGLVVALTAACTNYGGLMTVRFLLGVAEATITPAFMFITSTWYTRDEIPTRTGIWFSGNSVGGMAASLLAFVIGHVKDTVGPWRWMFITLGVATFLWAFVMMALLPDSISTAKFLSEEERQFASSRIVVAGTGRTEKTHWRWEQVQECLVDPKTWFLLALEMLTQIPNGGTQNFANLVIKSFGFTSLQSTLINIPYSLVSAGIIVGTGYLAGRFRHVNCLLIAGVVLPCVVGSALIHARQHTSKPAKLLGYFLLSSGSAAMPLALSLVQANYRGVTKKMTVTALLFLGYCVGNIAGPQFFRSEEAPTYDTAFRTIMVCYMLVVVVAMGLRFYLRQLNARRIREEGFVGSAGDAGVVGRWRGASLEALQEFGAAEVDNRADQRLGDYEDATDWQTVGFRYRY